MALSPMNGHDGHMHRLAIRLLALSSVIGVSACATEVSKFERQDDRPLATGPMSVRVLDSWFLIADGERLAISEFVYRCRIDCRRWEALSQQPPPILLTWNPACAPRSVLSDLMAQIQLAGFANVELTFEQAARSGPGH